MKRLRFHHALTAAYFALTLPLTLRHAMWRDELQSWLIARDSSSVVDLFTRSLRYEGHPGLWHLCLHLISRVFDDPRGMQVFHALAATTTVWVIARHSPFSKLQKVLLAGGYFFFYEYATISRSYVLGVLAVFAACALFTAQKRRLPLVALALALAAQTSVYGAILCIAFSLAVAADALSRGLSKDRLRELAAPVGIVVAGLALAVLQMRTPKDAFFPPVPVMHFGWEPKRLLLAASTLLQSWLPAFPLADYRWNHHLFDDELPEFQAALAALLFLAALLPLLKKPAAAVMVASAALGIVVFKYVVYLGEFRHHGHLFVALVIALWLLASPQVAELELPALNLPRLAPLVAPAFTATLVVHVLAAARTSGAELSTPFSASREATAFIKANVPATTKIVATLDDGANGICGQLGRPLYYANAGVEGSFVVWKRGRVDPPTPKQSLEEIHEAVERFGPDVVILAAGRALPRVPELKEVARFEKALLNDEVFYVYRPSGAAGAQPSLRAAENEKRE